MSRACLLVVAALLSFPMSASAHKFWLLPSQTSLSGSEPWVTVDAAISNDLFYFNHHAMPLTNLTISAPDRSTVEPENAASLRYRSVFDFPASQEGTYRVAIVNDGLFGSWEEDGERRRWRGTAETFAKEVPENATNLNVSETVSRVETFVTNGPLTKDTLKPTGRGLEMVPVTHPNDLYAGDQSRFRFLIDGEPAKELTVVAVKGGTRYRDAQNEIQATTDADGEATFAWSQAGMYWLEATTADDKTSVAQADNRRLTYVATLEVLPQ